MRSIIWYESSDEKNPQTNAIIRKKRDLSKAERVC